MTKNSFREEVEEREECRSEKWDIHGWMCSPVVTPKSVEGRRSRIEGRINVSIFDNTGDYAEKKNIRIC